MTLSVRSDQSNSKRKIVARRIGAYFVDTTMLMFAVQGAQWGFAAATGGFPFTQLAATDNGWLIYGWVLLTVSLPIWLYFVLFEYGRRQATPGKRLFGLRVVSEGGEKPSLGQLWSRTLLKLLPWEIFHLTFMLPTPMTGPNGSTSDFRPGFLVGCIVMGLYLLMMIRTPALQSIHDLIAKTVVTPRPFTQLQP